MKINDEKIKEYKFPSDKMVRTRVLAPLFTCKICNKLIKESTTIGDCLHSFCKKCIYKKVFEEKSRKCPICNVEFTDPPAKVLRPDYMMRSLKVRLLGSHKRTPEQRAESKRIRFENMQASNDQAKKPESTKKPVIICKNRTKEKVIVKPLEDEGTSSQSTKKPPITYKDKGNAIVTVKSSEDRRILKGKRKKKVKSWDVESESEKEDESYNPRKSLQAIHDSEKGIVIRSPPRSPPPPLHKNQVIYSKSEGKLPVKELVHMDNEEMAVTAAIASGSKSEEPKRRVRQKYDATPSNGTRICPQDVIDTGKYINPAKKTHSTWFILTPSEEQNRKEPLRSLPGPNVNIKFERKSHPTVSTLMKYIAMQLKLDSGEKVGIFMYGSLLSPEMKLADVVNQWIEIVGSERETTSIGTSAHFFCIKLTYA